MYSWAQREVGETLKEYPDISPSDDRKSSLHDARMKLRQQNGSNFISCLHEFRQLYGANDLQILWGGQVQSNRTHS